MCTLLTLELMDSGWPVIHSTVLLTFDLSSYHFISFAFFPRIGVLNNINLRRDEAEYMCFYKRALHSSGA